MPLHGLELPNCPDRRKLARNIVRQIDAPAMSVLTRLAALPQRVLMGLVHGYRLLLRPWLGNVCRFEPTCSAYALAALARHGAAGGSYLAARRILRCHPWCNGGCDPVPDTVPPPLPQSLVRLFAKNLP